MKFPILHDPGSIDMLLRTVSRTDPPASVDHDYLVNLGFKREVDEGLLKLLEFLGFIDEGGHPTVLWVNYSDPDSDADVLRNAIRNAYGELFDRYPRAFDQEGTILMDFFRSTTGASDNNTAYMILTFKVLCDLAEMGEEKTDTKPPVLEKPSPEPRKEAAEKEKKEKKDKRKPQAVEPAPAPDGKPVIRVSLNLDLDGETDPELRDLVMKVLRRQLKD